MFQYTRWHRTVSEQEREVPVRCSGLNLGTQVTNPGIVPRRVTFQAGEFNRESSNYLYQVGMLKRSMAGASFVVDRGNYVAGSDIHKGHSELQAHYRRQFYMKLKKCAEYEEGVFGGPIILGCDPRYRAEAYQRDLAKSQCRGPTTLSASDQTLLSVGSTEWAKHCFKRVRYTGRWELNLDRFHLIGEFNDTHVVPDELMVKRVGAYQWIYG